MIAYVTYKRVSTNEQGKSGLGLQAQDRDIQLFLEQFSDKPYKILKEYVEVESGKAKRPIFEEALITAKRHKAILLVANLDRLSRKVSEIATLMEDKTIEFKVASIPNADNFQLHIYAALAQKEREFISQRTKAALLQAKARGTKLGGLRDKTMLRNKAIQKEANEFAYKLEPIVTPLREQGKSLREIAHALNKANINTPRGANWAAPQVKRLLERLVS